MLPKILQEILNFSCKEDALSLKKFFKTDAGGYAEKDIFIGVKIPKLRFLAKKYHLELNLVDISELLQSKIHEVRSFALITLVEKFQKAKNFEEKDKIYNFYLKKTTLAQINNWDLVDLSCYKIIGEYLYFFAKEECFQERVKILYSLASEDSVWLRRIAVVSCLFLIKKNFFEDALNIINNLLQDKEDLIKKATGWMLREIGKKDETFLINFLKQNKHKMSRITFSYATERIVNLKKATSR